jgi:hypothetical protein
VPVERGQSVAKVEVVTEAEVGTGLWLRGGIHSDDVGATTAQVARAPRQANTYEALREKRVAKIKSKSAVLTMRDGDPDQRRQNGR